MKPPVTTLLFTDWLKESQTKLKPLNQILGQSSNGSSFCWYMWFFTKLFTFVLLRICIIIFATFDFDGTEIKIVHSVL